MEREKKTYPAEILKISSEHIVIAIALLFMCVFDHHSGNRRQLNKLCDALINFQITPEDLI